MRVNLLLISLVTIWLLIRHTNVFSNGRQSDFGNLHHVSDCEKVREFTLPLPLRPSTPTNRQKLIALHDMRGLSFGSIN